MISIASVFWKICTFRSGPDTLPHGNFLLGLVITANLVVSTALYLSLTDTDFFTSLTLVVVSLAGTCGLIWIIMTLMNQAARFNQTITAIIGADLLLTLLRAGLLPFGISANADANASVHPIAESLLTMLLVWNLLVFSYIFHRALNIHMFFGGLLAFFIFIFSIALSQAAVNPMTQHIYFLGIGGTLMGSLAQLAQQKGYSVSGSDNAVYPPMSDQLAQAGITVYEGFSPEQLDPEPDLIVIGNAGLPRGNEAVEFILERGMRYTSGAQWLGEAILQDRWVLAVAGTHGKTTTASMLAWILEHAGLKPGYLIGGAPLNFEQSARLGDSPFFIVEADEYDTSYFDRRSKFVHYRPRTLILNNLEYDHADIFDDIGAIQTQFHNLLRTVPQNGLIIAPSNDENLTDVLQRGCWTPVARVGDAPPRKLVESETRNRWHTNDASGDGQTFDVCLNEEQVGTITWNLLGKHNQANALNAIAAARHAGVPAQHAIEALSKFGGVKRRLEVLYRDDQFVLYDDFAHHPTAIRTTLAGLRKQVGNEEILAVIEPRTHTMSLGTLRHELTTCVAAADRVFWFRGENIKWDLTEIAQNCVIPAKMHDNHDNLVSAIVAEQDPKKRKQGSNGGLANSPKKLHVVIMSNGAFGGIYQNLLDQLPQQ